MKLKQITDDNLKRMLAKYRIWVEGGRKQAFNLSGKMEHDSFDKLVDMGIFKGDTIEWPNELISKYDVETAQIEYDRDNGRKWGWYDEMNNRKKIGKFKDFLDL